MDTMLARRFLPPLTALVAFEASARLGSFTAAAAELSLTQGAISRQIKLLEDRLGVKLFERARQRVTLTDAGNFYAGELRGVLQTFITATARTIAFRVGGGSLTIATLPTFGARWLVPRMPEFFARHPQIEINLSTRIRPFDFATEPFDAAILSGNDWPRATAHRLMDEELLVVASPQLVASANIDRPEDLSSQTLLMQATRPTAFEELAAFTGIPAFHGPRLRFEQFTLVLQAAIASLGIALVPHVLVRPELESGTLISLFDLRLKTDKGYYLVYPVGRDRLPALVDFRDWLLEAARAGTV